MIAALLRDLAFNGQSPAIIDEASTTVTYIGYCQPGTTAENLNRWCVKKIEVVNTITTIKWADGSQNYDKKWSERATVLYTYSYPK